MHCCCDERLRNAVCARAPVSNIFHIFPAERLTKIDIPIIPHCIRIKCMWYNSQLWVHMPHIVFCDGGFLCQIQYNCTNGFTNQSKNFALYMFGQRKKMLHRSCARYMQTMWKLMQRAGAHARPFIPNVPELGAHNSGFNLLILSDKWFGQIVGILHSSYENDTHAKNAFLC